MSNAPSSQGSPEAVVRDPGLLPAPSPLGEYCACELHGGAFCRGISSVKFNFPASISLVRPCPALSAVARPPCLPRQAHQRQTPRWGRRHAADVQRRRARPAGSVGTVCLGLSGMYSRSTWRTRARTLGLEGSAQPTGNLTLLLCCRIGPCVDCTPAGTPTPQHPQRRDAFYPPYGALDCQLLVFLG